MRTVAEDNAVMQLDAERKEVKLHQKKEYKMATLKSGIKLANDENLVMEIEAELWASSSNPFAKMMGLLRQFFALILGTKIKCFWVITNKRVVVVTELVNWYCFPVRREIRNILPQSITAVGYTREATCWCFCPAYTLYYNTVLTEGITIPGSVLSFIPIPIPSFRNSIRLKDVDDEAVVLQAVNAFTAAILHKEG
jgi:hypothetical protein